jgi:cation diffusion facilitator family transporter
MNSPIIEGEKVALRTMVHLGGLAGLKIFAGIFTGMTVMIADGVNSIADTLSIFGAYIGLRVSRKSEDKNFKYGYHKVETFMAFLISVGITYVGYLLAVSSVNIFLYPEEGQYRVFAISIAIIAILTSYKFYKRLKVAGEKANSLALIASAKDKKMDMFTGVAVLISIIANYQAIPYIEGIVSGIISILVLKVGLFSAKESLFFLLDYWDDPILERKIRGILYGDKSLILKVKNLKLRRAGTFIFGEAYVEINPFAGMQDLREELNFLRDKIKKSEPHIKDFSIYTHIPDTEKLKLAIPIVKGIDLKAEVAHTLRATKAYLILKIENNKVKKIEEKKITAAQKTPAELISFFKEEDVNVVIDNGLHSLVYYNLRRIKHIIVYPNFPDIKKAEDALKLFLIDD